MPTALPKRFESGTELTADMMNTVLEELWRLRRMDAAPPLTIDNADSDQAPIFLFHGSLDIIPAQSAGGVVAAGSLASPTQFTANILDRYGAVNGDLAATGGGAAVTAYNSYPGSIPANALIFLVYTAGEWRVLSAGCS